MGRRLAGNLAIVWVTTHCGRRTGRDRRDRRRVAARRRPSGAGVRAHPTGVDRGQARRRRSDRGARPGAHRSRHRRGPRRRRVAGGQGHPERGCRRPGWPGCATRTPWCAPCRTASSRSNGSAATARRRPWCPAPCGSRPRRSREGWVRLRTAVRLVLPDDEASPTAGRAACGGPRLTVETRPRLRRRGLAQAAGQRRRGTDGADRGASRGCSAATTSPRLGARLPRRVPRGGPGGGRHASTTAWSTRSSACSRRSPEDLTTSMLTDREHGPAAGVGHSQRRRSPARPPQHGLATPISDVLVPLLAAASDGPG